MNTYKLSNISLAAFRSFLKKQDLTCTPGKGGHEVWSKPGLLRPIILQTHIDPVPEFIVQNAIRDLGMKRNKFIEEFFVAPQKKKKK